MRLFKIWERLHEIKGMTIEEVEEWLQVNDEDYDDDFEIDDINDDEIHGYVGGFWSDFAPVIVFENGRVTKWFRTGAWE